MEIKYDLDNNIYFTKNGIEMKLDPEEAIDIAYAIIDSYGLDYKMLDDLQAAYEEDK